MEKRIIIAIAGPEGKEIKGVAILPTTRVSDVLTKLKLLRFQLASPKGGMFTAGDDLYQSVAEGQKVYAVQTIERE